MHEDKGSKTVWVQGGISSLNKRQCTVQLTVFADGVPCVKPLVIFRGTGNRITFLDMIDEFMYAFKRMHGVMNQP